jgi:cytochrome c oxidase assembly protein subunit 15
MHHDIMFMTKITTGIIFLQLILGATMRHMGAGLAIPDFPLAFGEIIPPFNSPGILIHFLHRTGAVLVGTAILITAYKVWRYQRGNRKMVQPVIILIFALILQVLLAALTIWTKKAMLPTTLHVITGAFMLGGSLFLTLRAHMYTESSASEIQNGIVNALSAT